MKKLCHGITRPFALFKFNLKMKLTALCFLVSLFGLHASNSYSQKTVTLKLKDVQVSQLLDLIESQTEYHFVYKIKDVNLTRKIQVNAQDEKVSGVLEKIFKGTDTKYEFYEDQIFLTRQPAKLSSSTTPINLQETITVTGTVTEAETGMPVPAANILEKGTSNGVMSDFDGNYSIEVPEDAILKVSYIGYATKEINVNGRNEIDIVLETDAAALDEVVVVGYGTQNKKDLTGSITSIGGDEITERSVTNVSSALQGSMPGVSVTRSSSEPGASASVQIRGVTTLEGSSDPLILVDDVPVESMDDVNPDQIESISVLKDAASAAIYGSRAAAGVVIITTKRAKTGVFNIRYRGEQIMNTPTEVRSNVGVLRWMEMDNEKGWNDSGNTGTEFPVHSQERIENYLTNNAENPDQYPITDWVDRIIKDYSLGSRHNLTLSGGSERVKTIASLGYEKQNGIYANREWKRYSTRINNDLKLTDKFGAIADFSVNIEDGSSPILNPTSRAVESAPIYAATWSDGRIAAGKSGDNAYARLHEGGFVEDKKYEIFGRIGVYYEPIENLKISLNLSPRYDFTRYKSFSKSIPYWDFDDPDRTEKPSYMIGHNASQTNLNENRAFYNTLTTQALVNYNKSIGDHNFTGLLGFEEFSSEREVLGVEGREFVSTEYPFLNQAPIDKIFNDGTSFSELSYSSYFGRISYNYNEKYYFQGNLRRDASSRFGSEYRWGTFPSASVGWVVSNEDFFQSLDSSISFLKFRASYGELGNDRLGNYLYLSVLEFSNSLFPSGSNVVAQRSAAQRFLATQDITWETTASYNLGFDITMLDYRLSITGDYYNKETTDMLLALSIPDFSGYEDPMTNVGSMNTRGWGVSATWADNLGDFEYSASFNVFDSKSIVGDIEGKRIIESTTISQEGELYNAWYGYKSSGLFQTQEEVENSPVTSGSVGPGDVKYIDVSGPNGEPDGVINELDRTILGGSPLPRYQYGGNLELAYKGFDFGVTIQGVGKQKAYLTEQHVRPLRQSWMSAPSILEGNYWSVYNSPAENENVRYPRLSETSVDNNYRFSDFWLIDGSYLRLKNISLGYTLREGAIQKTGISKLRIYLSGNDLLSIDNFPEGIDPEYGGGYLITKTYLLGVNIQI